MSILEQLIVGNYDKSAASLRYNRNARNYSQYTGDDLKARERERSPLAPGKLRRSNDNFSTLPLSLVTFPFKNSDCNSNEVTVGNYSRDGCTESVEKNTGSGGHCYLARVLDEAIAERLGSGVRQGDRQLRLVHRASRISRARVKRKLALRPPSRAR